MLKLTIVMLAVMLAGTASAAGWRSLQVDGSSEEAFKASLEAFRKELSPARQQVFSAALIDIWIQGTTDAKANQREYTANDYYRQLDKLTYEEVVIFTDPTGETAKARKRDADRSHVASTSPPISPPLSANQKARMEQAHRTLDSGSLMRTRTDSKRRGETDLTGGGAE
jgi:hypothetical protein